MAGIRIACQGCQRPIETVHVKPGEDDTDPWHVTVPEGHSVLCNGKYAVSYRCSTGTDYVVPLPKRESESDRDVEDQLWESARQQFIDGKHPYNIATEMNLPRSVMRRWIYTDGLNDRPSLRESGDLTPEVLERAMRKVGMLSEKAADTVEHETWLEYHDRLVKEYYDVEAEWALIKEICPELDRPEPAPRRVRRAKFHPYHGVAAGFVFMAVLNFMIGATVVGVVWLMAALTMLMAASRR